MGSRRRFWGFNFLETGIVKIADFFVHDGFEIGDRSEQSVFQGFFGRHVIGIFDALPFR